MIFFKKLLCHPLQFGANTEGARRSTVRHMGGDRSLVSDTDPPAVHYDDEELPARTLTGRVGLGVAIVAFAVALLVIWQVFRPLARGSEFYLIIFLAGTLPLIFLAYRARPTGAGRPCRTGCSRPWR